ncbi:SMC family ATPase, partial [Candidatus Bathyarchaeota archaeon]|nr:SMC family ATPase [Candidatus Bathyarchaeota archaeon]
MNIEAVELENIRSHVKTKVPFNKGFNCLVGGLGCGKSSILYAIDFALFGEPLGRSYDYLLREGASSGKVTLHFSHNGKHYKIVRGLKRRGKGIGQDFDELRLYQDETLIASIKSDAVEEQINAITGLDRDIFREIVWIRQERLKELLNVAPRERQKRIDELFGLSDYELAWSNLAGYQREYEGEKKAYEKDPDIAGLENLSKEYNQLAEELALLEIDIQNLSKKLDNAKKALEEADRELKRLEEFKASIEELRRKEAQLQASLVNTEDSAAALAEKIEGKKAAIENLEKRMKNMQMQLNESKSMLKEAGIPENLPIAKLQQHLLSFDEQIASLKAEQEALIQTINANEKRVSSLSTESKCPLCLQPLNSEYKSSLTRRLVEENEEKRSTISQLQMEIAELQQIKEKAASAISNIQVLASRIDDLQRLIDEERKALENLMKEFQEKQNLENELRIQLAKVRTEIKSFDVSELERAKTRRDSVFREYYFIESELRTKTNRKKDIMRRIDELKERIDNAQQKLERMNKLTKIIEIISDIREAYRSIQPKMRSELVKVLRNFVQQVLDSLIGEEGNPINVMIDETYTPYVLSEEGVERDVSNLSGGERTLIAFAYRMGLGQLIMQSKTGHGLSFLLLDEPTESLGQEDGSINRLAEVISRFKAVEQIIAVTHSEAFAEKAEHVIR